MALNLVVEQGYNDRPEVLVRVSRAGAWIDAWAMIDTGAEISLFDLELASALPSLSSIQPDQHINVLGVGGIARRTPFWNVEVLVASLPLRVGLPIGLVPELAKSTGNLLGRDFLESVHVGLDQRNRLLYLGRAAGG
ncbi:MAG: hypothetical protein HY723_00285 [Chloroflexi bacterium]|nr:hypothetical protein [Chloroflexota bacterium]